MTYRQDAMQPVNKMTGKEQTTKLRIFVIMIL